MNDDLKFLNDAHRLAYERTQKIIRLLTEVVAETEDWPTDDDYCGNRDELADDLNRWIISLDDRLRWIASDSDWHREDVAEQQKASATPLS